MRSDFNVWALSAAAHAAVLAALLLLSPPAPDGGEVDEAPEPAIALRMEPLVDVTVDSPAEPEAAPLPSLERAEAAEPAFERPDPPAESAEPARRLPDPPAVAAPRRPFVRPSARLASGRPAPAPSAVVVSSPAPRDNPHPKYPDLARKRRWEGRVEVGVEVAPDGSVARTWIVAGSGHEILDEAAERGVASWTFEPGRPGRITVPVRFTLTS